VINCNLQRLDGPVRGNAKIVQELEGSFRGAGWNVIKVLWGSGWDKLLAQDTNGLLQRRMMEVVDGEYQNYKSKNGAYVRQHFFGKSPELLAMVVDLSDDDIWALTRGGNDMEKVFAAYKAATEHKDQPTLILAKTVKGFGMGSAGESQNVAHQTKKLSDDDMIYLRNRFNIPLSDDEAKACKFYLPAADAPELKYMHERRAALGGALLARRRLLLLVALTMLALVLAVWKLPRACNWWIPRNSRPSGNRGPWPPATASPPCAVKPPSTGALSLPRCSWSRARSAAAIGLVAIRCSLAANSLPGSPPVIWPTAC
jgi:pyruvate dehydrogenase complex dehydrogenase (E1) component